MTIKAIETSYAGCHFRSRLEARWAVFFDALKIEWQYEPQGYELPSGRYLPDFYLPGIRGGSWFEVKGAEPETDYAEKLLKELSAMTEHDSFLAFGDIPNERSVQDCNGSSIVWVNGWDCTYRFCTCSTCGKIGLEYWGRGERVCDHPGTSTHADYTYGHPRLLDAYAAARGARFEFGESGAAMAATPRNRQSTAASKAALIGRVYWFISDHPGCNWSEIRTAAVGSHDRTRSAIGYLVDEGYIRLERSGPRGGMRAYSVHA